MRRSLLHSALALSLCAIASACTEKPISSLSNPTVPKIQASGQGSAPAVVISQVYGGGGNTNAPYNSDFIELFNPGTASVDISGWRVHYGSSGGTTWSNTTTIRAGTVLQPGQYYLIKEASGSIGSALPQTPDSGTINMSASAGKVVLTNSAVTLAGACPTDASIVDRVSFGSTNCSSDVNWPGTTGAPSNTMAAIRNSGGCAYTGSLSADFTIATPTPRNSGAPLNPCQPTGGDPAVVILTPATQSIVQGTTFQFAATAFDAGNNPTTTTYTWGVTDSSVASIASDGTVTGLQPGDVTVKAISANNVTGTAQLHVDAPVVASVTVSPISASIVQNATQQFTAVAYDSQNRPIPSATFTWGSTAPGVATVDNSGLASGLQPGDATITATTPNGIVGNANLHVDPAFQLTGDIVISQVYGGGGNGGASYTHDYVELFNRGTQAQIITGWKVVYTSAAGTFSTSNTTTLPAGSIDPGKYYLVQLASNNVTVGSALPTADATGSTNMGGGAGKVLLALPTATVSGACPAGADIIDRVAYGANSTTASNCATEWGGRTADLTSTTAAFRNNDGCTDTGSGSADFAVLPANPHNSASAFKSCTGQPPRPQSSATLVINELMGDPVNAESASWGEWFEVYNYGTQPIDLQGWQIISGGTSQPNHTINASVIVPAGGYAVLGRGFDPNRNGGVDLDYNYFTGGTTTIWLDNVDYLMLVDAANARVDSVAWTSLPRGVTKGVRDASLPHANVDGSNWGYASVNFGAGDYGTPDAANDPLVDTAPVLSANKLTFSGRTLADAPVPVGFEAQMFANESDANGTPIFTTITWTALTPNIATVDADGVLHGLAAGTATFRATAADGTTRTNSIIVSTPVASATAQYLNSTAFGDPIDLTGRASFIVRRTQYTTSYNVDLGIPNWVAYDLNGTHIQVGQDRCNCFTFDPGLPANYPRYTTADYTGAGTFAGYGIDRGHLVRSLDRTTGTLDNALTFYFSNVLPQAADLNQGPWANQENYLGDLALNQNKEVYIYAGPAGTRGTVKNEGKITIPQYTWKVAVILPRGQGLTDVHDYTDITVIATVMPNVPGVRGVDWNTYKVTVDSVEALTGYDLLSLLPDNIETAVESNTHPPVAALNGPYNANAHDAVSFSAAASSDADGDALTYQWSFGDGSTAAGVTATHTYLTSGDFTVRLVVTDTRGIADTATSNAHIVDITPAVITPTVTGTLGSNNWYTSNVQISWTATDDESGVTSAPCVSASVTADTNGDTFTCNAVNGAGLTSTSSVTIKRDASAPTVTYSGNAGTYTVADAINITCTPTDVGPSGVATSTCANITGSGYSFALGNNSFSATVKDNAGNAGSGSTSFTVTVSTASLSSLVIRWVVPNGVENALVQILAAAQAAADRGDLVARANQLDAFVNALEAQRNKAISSENADTLIRLVRSL